MSNVRLDRAGAAQTLEQLAGLAASVQTRARPGSAGNADLLVHEALGAARALHAARSMGGPSVVSDAMQSQARSYLAAIRAGADVALRQVAAATAEAPRLKSWAFDEAVDYLARDRSVAMLVAGNGTKLGLDAQELPELTHAAEKVARFFARGARFNLVGGGDQLQSDVLKYDVSNARAALADTLRDLGTRQLAFQSDCVEGSAWDVSAENDAGVCYVPSLKRDGTLATDAADVVWGGRSVIDGREVLHGATWGYLNADLTSALDCHEPVTRADLQRALTAGRATSLPRYALIGYGGGAITFEEIQLALERGVVVFQLAASPRTVSRDKDGTEVPNPAVTSPGFRGDAAVKISEKLRSGEWVHVPATALGIPESRGVFLTLR